MTGINTMQNIIIIILLTIFTLFAQWSTDPWQNTPVNTQFAGQINPEVCTDGKSGALIAFMEKGQEIYIQRLDKYGYMMWDSAGLPVCTATGTQEPIKMISDGAGGALILWKDNRDRGAEQTIANALYVQKIDSMGHCIGEHNGIILSPYEYHSEWDYTTSYNDIISDGQGGAYICWGKRTDSLGAFGIYAPCAYVQHIDKDGKKTWGKDGKMIEVIPGGIKIVPDNENGLYCITNGKNIIRLNDSGEMIWTDTIKTDIGYIQNVISDNAGGIIMNSYNHNIVDTLTFQRINSAGQKLWNNVHLPDSGRILYYFTQLYPTGNSGALIRWADGTSYSAKCYVQKLDSTGQFLFNFPGINSVLALANEEEWFDLIPERNYNNDTDYRVYIQKYNCDGKAVWPDKGILIRSRDVYYQGWGMMRLISDQNGGLIYVWDETKHFTEFYDIVAQQVSENGNLGEVIVSLDGKNHERFEKLQSFELLSAYPNPFNTSTSIRFKIYEKNDYKLQLYSIIGQEVLHIVFRELNPGQHKFNWKGVNGNGNNLSSGVYFVILSNSKRLVTMKIVMLK